MVPFKGDNREDMRTISGWMCPQKCVFVKGFVQTLPCRPPMGLLGPVPSLLNGKPLRLPDFILGNP